MKVYKIKVNGKTYRVELEAIEENNAPSAAKAEEKKQPAAPESKPLTTGDKTGQEVLSPIQGVVNKVLIKVGDKVKKGDVLFVVEAMKLENDVVSPFDGEVTEVLADKGANVASKQPLCRIG